MKELFKKDRNFILILFGQTVSLIGSALTDFALGVWIFQQTGSVTQYTLVAVCLAVPALLLSPFAGVLVDRWDRRWVMVLSDTGSALKTLAVLGLVFVDGLEIWHIYVITAVGSAFSAFQYPAYGALIPQLVRKENLARANGLIELSSSAAMIISPALAGVLLASIQLKGVILVDIATFLIAIATLIAARIPRHKAAEEATEESSSMWQEMTFGWRYIWQRPALVRLLGFFLLINLFTGISFVLFTPLILTLASAAMLGTLLSIGSVGAVLGGLTLTTWGGPKRLVYGIFGGAMMVGLCLAITGLGESLVWVAVGIFGVWFSVPIIDGCSQALWQKKVKPEVQGRVFSIRSMVAQGLLPVAYFLSGVLADDVFEPLLLAGGPLADSVGSVIGVGPGRGLGLLFIMTGGLTLLAGALGLLLPRFRSIEDELPDELPEDFSEGESSGQADLDSAIEPSQV